MPRRGTCKAKYKLDKHFHDRTRSFVFTKMSEQGGDTHIDHGSRTIHANKTVRGGYSRVDIPRGKVDYHTHPGRCLDDNNCTVGIPSPPDLINILFGVLKGTEVHLVYSREGTYAIYVKPELRNIILRQRRVPTDLKKAISHEFEGLHNTFKNTPSLPYSWYFRQWMSRVKKYGFIVKFHKHKRRPTLELTVPCKQRAHKRARTRKQSHSMASRRRSRSRKRRRRR